jgi:hypothetical protein
MLTRAARRRTAPRARTPSIIAKAKVAVARNTSTVNIVDALVPNIAKVAVGSIAQILKLTILNMMRLPMLIQPAAESSNILVKCSCQTEE